MLLAFAFFSLLPGNQARVGQEEGGQKNKQEF